MEKETVKNNINLLKNNRVFHLKPILWKTL